jgi:hypothetical protein
VSLATDLQDDIADLLDDDDYGRDVTLRDPGLGTFNPVTQTTAAATDSDYTTRALILGYRDRERDGERILAQDRKAVLKVKDLDVVPRIGWHLIVGSATYIVVSFKTIELGGTDILYTLQIRAAASGS